MAEKIHRPYRRVGLNTSTRLALLFNHIKISQDLGLMNILAKASSDPLEIAHFSDRDGTPYLLTLTRPGQFGKEGEVAMHLTNGQERLYTACFSLCEVLGVRELDIGSLQGPGSENGREVIRQLTRGMHGLRPRSLMLEALRAFAQHTHCMRLRMTGNALHIYRSWHKRKDIRFDYDAFCAEITGVQHDSGDWLIPLVGERSPLSEVPSKKRAEATRRRDLLDEVGQSIKSKLPLNSTAHLSIPTLLR
jgi:hypothetical protein